MIDGALSAGNLTSPATNANGILILRAWTCDFAEGHTRNAMGSAANDPSNVAGQPMIDKFNERIEWMLREPTQAGNMLQGGSSASSRMKSYPQNNTDDLSIDDDDFAPKFTDAPEQW